MVTYSGNRQFLAMVACGSKVGNQGVPISGNRQFLAMVTCGSEVRNEEFQPTGNLWFPGSELAVSNLGTGPLSKTNRSVPEH